VDDSVHALAVVQGAVGPMLYAGGNFTQAGEAPASHVAKWEGGAWSPLGEGLQGGYVPVRVLAAFDSSAGAALYAGGDFLRTGAATLNRIAVWSDSGWSALGEGVSQGFYAVVNALAAVDELSGPVLYAGGIFTSAGGAPMNSIGKWDGIGWSALGEGIATPHPGLPIVRALAAFDDGTGTALYVGGGFRYAGQVLANSVAKWDGVAWSDLAGGMGFSDWPGVGSVRALAVFNDGNSLALYAGGWFTLAGGTPANSIARWDGANWSSLGNGFYGGVYALAAFDDGSGPALYAGGDFAFPENFDQRNIAKWNGAAWSPLGSGTSSVVSALAVFDDGSGPAMYAGGFFTSAGGIESPYIARWDGASWSPVGGGTNNVILTLAAFDDGTGRALFAGGVFSVAGGTQANGVAKWNGHDWQPLGSGIDNPNIDGAVVLAPVPQSSHAPRALYVGGDFTMAGGIRTGPLAKWAGCPYPGNCDNDGDVDLVDAQQFVACLTGPGGVGPPPCACARFDGDDDIDLLDFGGFQITFGGSVP
jgi:hypothetical protein